jgi:hypothetical protein
MDQILTARAMAAANERGMDMTKVRPHTLILAAQLTASESNYAFDLRQSAQENILPGVVRGLLDRDGFLASGMAIGLIKVPVIGGKEYPTSGTVSFFPDKNLFAEPAGVAPNVLAEAQALESIYFGDHTLKTNEGIRLDKNPNFLFRHVHQTQASATTAGMLTGEEFKDIGADVRFAGGDENEVRISIKCDDKTLIGGPAASNNYLLVFLIGAVSKGATTKRYIG